MHKLYEYACKELEELEQKAPKGLSAAEFEYADKLTELKKNILKIEMLEEKSEDNGSSGRGMSRRGMYDGRYNGMYGGSYEGGNSYRGGSYEGGSYEDGASGRRGRDSMGRYTSREGGKDFYSKLDDLMQEAPSESERMALADMVHRMKR